MAKQQSEDRLIHIACDVDPRVFGQLLLVLHDARVENLNTIVPDHGMARFHQKKALGLLPKPNGSSAPYMSVAERHTLRDQRKERLLAILREHPDGITAQEIHAKYLTDQSVNAVAVPLDRLWRKKIVLRTPQKPFIYRIREPKARQAKTPQVKDSSKPETVRKKNKSTKDPALSNKLLEAVAKHPNGLNVKTLHALVGKGQYSPQQVGATLFALHAEGRLNRNADQPKNVVYSPKEA